MESLLWKGLCIRVMESRLLFAFQRPLKPLVPAGDRFRRVEDGKRKERRKDGRKERMRNVFKTLSSSCFFKTLISAHLVMISSFCAFCKGIQYTINFTVFSLVDLEWSAYNAATSVSSLHLFKSFSWRSRSLILFIYR